ncbi:MAG: hypothetical protein A2Y76_13800 [Planctomycetes bacterium RBG_13_60_9]|nr:MAG: hypothetical protein A2Y76_13800 [Planctomycetes bacterium RBG_13_60_9]
MRRVTILLLSCAIIGSLASGCYSPKPIPKAYFESKSQMSVAVGKCPEKAQMSDSGGGGLIGAMVTAGRAGAMNEAMSGITGDTVKELVRQRFSEKMEEYFDVYDEGPLKTVIDIQQWGWYVPTTVVGIKTGSYQFILSGTVTMTDTAQKRKPRIANLLTQVSETIGNKPTAAVSQEALLKCADKFAAQTVTFLVKEQTAEPKSR